MMKPQYPRPNTPITFDSLLQQATVLCDNYTQMHDVIDFYNALGYQTAKQGDEGKDKHLGVNINISFKNRTKMVYMFMESHLYKSYLHLSYDEWKAETAKYSNLFTSNQLGII